MSAVFYWTGALIWTLGGISFVTSILWYFALKAIANAGNLAEFAKFSVIERQWRRDSDV